MANTQSIAVIGLGQFGYQLATGLTQQGFDVLAIDSDEEVVNEIKDLVSQAVVLDSTDEKAMQAVNIDAVDKAIVAIGNNVESSLLSTALLQRFHVNDLHVRIISPLQERILRSMGIKELISIEKEMGVQLAKSLSSKGIGRYVAISQRHSLIETAVPEKFVKKSLKDLSPRTQYGINIVGIKINEPTVQDDGEITYNLMMTDIPDPNYLLKKDDILVISGTDDNLNKFIQFGSSEE